MTTTWPQRAILPRVPRDRAFARVKKLTRIRIIESSRYANRCLSVNLDVSWRERRGRGREKQQLDRDAFRLLREFIRFFFFFFNF